MDRFAPRKREGGDGQLLGKEDVRMSGWGHLCMPHADGWDVQKRQPIIATTACRASTVHDLRWGHFQAPQRGHFQTPNTTGF